MKKYYLTLGMILVIGLAFLTPKTVNADEWSKGWEVNRVGYSTANPIIRLYHSDIDAHKWFRCVDNKNEILAILLTAKSIGEPIAVYVDDITLTTPTVTQAYIMEN